MAGQSSRDPVDAPLVGAWAHAHEEDHDGVQVYRPADAPLGPSRGRTGLSLRADRSAVVTTPGAADGGRSREGEWSLEAGRLRVRCAGFAGDYQVVAAGPELLELRPAPAD